MLLRRCAERPSADEDQRDATPLLALPPLDHTWNTSPEHSTWWQSRLFAQAGFAPIVAWLESVVETVITWV
jgi:hypothetical protein